MTARRRRPRATRRARGRWPQFPTRSASCAPPSASLDADAAIATFAALRSWNIALLKTVTPQQAARRVTHPERGEMPFSVIVETMAGHDLNHLTQIENIVMANG